MTDCRENNLLLTALIRSLITNRRGKHADWNPVDSENQILPPRVCSAATCKVSLLIKLHYQIVPDPLSRPPFAVTFARSSAVTWVVWHSRFACIQ